MKAIVILISVFFTCCLNVSAEILLKKGMEHKVYEKHLSQLKYKKLHDRNGLEVDEYDYSYWQLGEGSLIAEIDRKNGVINELYYIVTIRKGKKADWASFTMKVDKFFPRTGNLLIQATKKAVLKHGEVKKEPR